MKTWIRRSLIGLFGAAVLAGGLLACSHHAHPHGWGSASADDVAEWRGRVVQRAARELDLDDAQQQRLGLLFDKVVEQRSALVGSTSQPRDALRQLVAGERFDRDRANALVEEKTAALRAKSPEVIVAAADFYDGLRPEQQAKVRSWLDRRSRWGGRG